MRDYIVTCKKDDGEVVEKRVSARNHNEAAKTLADEGWEIVGVSRAVVIEEEDDDGGRSTSSPVKGLVFAILLALLAGGAVVFFLYYRWHK